MTTRLQRALVCGALLVAPSLAGAQNLSADPVIVPADRLQWGLGTSTLAVPGELRWVASHAGATPYDVVDPAAPDGGRGDGAMQLRLRVRPSWVGQASGLFYLYKVAADAEVSGHLIGGDAPLGLEHDPHLQFRDSGQGPRLTQAYALAVGRYVALKMGLVRGQFGLGIVANAGEDAEPDRPEQSPFDVAYAHDRNLRFQLALLPFEPVRLKRGGVRNPLALVVAADAVMDDDTANWSHGDRTYQVLSGALLHLDGLRLAAGTLYRQQAYAEGGETAVWVAAVTGRWDVLRHTHRLWVEGELASYFGESDLSQSAVREGPFDVRATGWVARAGYGRSGYDLVLEGGFASGDDNPFDDQINTFTFDREHRVGLLLFRQAMRINSAATAYNAADPTFRGTPSRGFDQLPTGGAIQNAIYINPRLRHRVVDGLTADLGYVYARSAVPVADAFQSGLAGGAPVGWRGARGARELGHELDFGLAYDWRLTYALLRFRTQLAVFLPGEAFQTALGEDAPTQWGALSHLEVRW